MKHPITIALTKKDIDAIFKRRNRKKWNKDLAVYDYLVREIDNAHVLPDYSRKFNYFYQVRRNAAWRKKFYAIFHASRGKEIDFADIMDQLFKKTGQVEASFASKLAATLDPRLPIIDRHVLSYIGRKLPPSHKESKERILTIIALHREMKREFKKFLKHKTGKYLLKRFRAEHPLSTANEMKMLDFVLWQSGGNGTKR